MNKKSKLILASALLITALMLFVPLTQADLPGGGGQENHISNETVLSNDDSEFNDSNSVFVNSDTGDDETGEGTNSKPYKSITKALTSDYKNIVFLNSVYTAADNEKSGIEITSSEHLILINQNDEAMTFNISFTFNSVINNINGKPWLSTSLLGSFIFNEKVFLGTNGLNSEISFVNRMSYSPMGQKNNITLNAGLQVGKDISASVSGINFKNCGISAIDSGSIYIGGCTFLELSSPDDSPDNLNAISLINCAGEIHISDCYINNQNYPMESTSTSASTRGILIDCAGGNIRLYRNTILNTDFNAIQITNLKSDLEISRNILVDWDHDNDHFSTMTSDNISFKDTSGGRAIRIDLSSTVGISILDNRFIKDYGATPNFIDSHQYDGNVSSVPQNAYDDGNVLKISTNNSSTLSSLTFIENTLANTSHSPDQLLSFSSADRKYLILPNGSMPSVAEFGVLGQNPDELDTVYGMPVSNLVEELHIFQSNFINFSGFLPYVSGFEGYCANDTELQEGNYLVFKLNLPDELILSDLANVDGPILSKHVGYDDNGNRTEYTTEYSYSDIAKDFNDEYNENSNYIFYVIRLDGKTDLINFTVDWDGNGTKYLRSEYVPGIYDLELGLKDDKCLAIAAPLVDQRDPTKLITPEDYSLIASSHSSITNHYNLHIIATGITEHMNAEGNLGYWVGVAIPVPEGVTWSNVKYLFTEQPVNASFVNAKEDDFVVLDNTSQKYICFYVDVNAEPLKTLIEIAWDGNKYETYTYNLNFSKVLLSIPSDEVKTAPIADNPNPGEQPIDTDLQEYGLTVLSTSGGYESTIYVTAKNVPYHRNANGDWGYWIGIGFKAPLDAEFESSKVYADWIDANYYYSIEQNSFDGEDNGYYTFYFDLGDPNNHSNKASISIDWTTEQYVRYSIDFSDVTIQNSSPYTVGFDSTGGSLVNHQSIEAGQKIVKPENPTKTGNAFIGWYSDADFTTPWDFENDTVTTNIVLYAKWGYSVEYISDDVTFTTQVVEINQKTTAPSDPKKDGYIFEGWWYVGDDSKYPWNFEYIITENMQLYAKWSKFCDVVIKIYNAQNEPWSQLDISLGYHDNSILKQIPLKESQVELGTYETTAKIKSGNYTLYIENVQYLGYPDPIEVTDDQTFTIDGVCSLTLDMTRYIQDAIGTIYLGKDLLSVNDLGLMDEDFSNYGYNLDGWYTDKNLTQKYDPDVKIVENVCLYIKLIPLSGGSGGGGTAVTPPVVPEKPTTPDSNDDVKLNLDDKTVNELIQKAISSGSNSLALVNLDDVQGAVSSVTVLIADLTKLLEKIADNDHITFILIMTSEGEISIDKTLLSSILENMTGDSISFELKNAKDMLTEEQKKTVGDNPVYDINIRAGSEYVKSFNGKTITVSIPYELKDGEDPNNIVVYYLKDDGTVEKMKGTYKDGKVLFETNHLSKFVIVYEAQEPVTPDNPDKPDQPAKDDNDNTLYYAIAAIVVILLIVALAYYFLKKKQ